MTTAMCLICFITNSIDVCIYNIYSVYRIVYIVG